MSSSRVKISCLRLKAHPIFHWCLYNKMLSLSLLAVSSYITALKTSIRSQTEFQPKLMASATISNVRTNDIFTSVLIQHGRKALNEEDMGSTRRDQLHYFGQVSGTRVEHCEEIFIDTTNDERKPKRILLTGKAGIGKTLFCQKLVRDWADDKLFISQSQFKFVYLLTFRQLNLLQNGLLSLQDLLNCSTVLDDSSNIDDSLFEYIVSHPEEVLIIIDGYDEYSQQDYVSSELEEQYQNTAQEKMPVAALCTKLIKGKLLRDSVVMITSRPEESDKMGGISFDRYVEIAGFSPEQVQEFIKKYFRENNTMKNAVLDHVMKNENLVSFAHIPMLCFLMCFCMEYALQTSKSNDDLPVSTTEIYSEAVNIFELKHNATSEYRKKEIPEKFKGSNLVENTLDKLSALAAELLLQSKPIFEESDMKGKFNVEEIEKLKESGLLHCGPPFRKSLLETTKYLSFTHLTIQEYLAARWFVMRNEIPNDVSEMALQFMAGILSKKRNGELMEKLLESILSSSRSDSCLLSAKCLSEYQDKEFAKKVIKNHPHHYSKLLFLDLNDVDCMAISFLLDVFSVLNEEEATTAEHQRSEQSFTVNDLTVAIISSSLTLAGIKRLCKSLEKQHCPVTTLVIAEVRLTDECVDCINGLVCSKLTRLGMIKNGITDTGVTSLCDALTHPSCIVTTLELVGTQITDTGVTSLCDVLTHPSCKVTKLDLSDNQITDTGVTSLCDALTHPSCKVTTLELIGTQITDTGVTSLCDALTHPSCKVTTLVLNDDQITDTSVTSLCDALTHPSCKVTTLDLSGNQITDTGVTSLCDALTHPSCKVTTLVLNDDQITDTSVTSLCDALTHPSCKVTTLELIGTQITDTGVTSLCDALTHPSCKVTTLVLNDDQITDTSVTSLCDALTHPSCKVTTLDLSGNQITDTGVTSLVDALTHPSCKVTKLYLSDNQITHTGVTRLCETVQNDNCKLVELDVRVNYAMSMESEQFLRNLVKQHRPGFELKI